MSARKIALIATLGLAPMLVTAPPALSGNKIDIQTPGASIDLFKGNKRIEAGDAEVKIKPGNRTDCLRIKAGNARVNKGKIKKDECQS